MSGGATHPLAHTARAKRAYISAYTCISNESSQPRVGKVAEAKLASALLVCRGNSASQEAQAARVLVRQRTTMKYAGPVSR